MEVARVQAIATLSKAMDTIPDEFIRPHEEQPALTTFKGPVPEIPTIDLSDHDQDYLVHTVANASREWGLFQVVNHGIPVEVISKLQTVGKEFFELSQEEKEVYARPADSVSLEGYGTNLAKEAEVKTCNWVDYLFHNVWPPSRINYGIWPKNPPSYREANEEYTKFLKSVVDKLLTYLSLGLRLKGNAIKEAVGGDNLEYLLKINYYPPCPRPDLALGVAPHTDMSTITVLVPNEVPGLQVFKDDHWFDAKYIPNALIIHIGDQTEVKLMFLIIIGLEKNNVSLLTENQFHLLERSKASKSKERIACWALF
ncbi:hypothetical protein IFM89_009832 [Coptis chinensis]|uniref:Fe2OG dioxygenase domain-containing protein n=1 Tax=Coptis chinensis TaxID=261450 RepID=A0A835I0Y6_9MAGN|nr:hypothetical protein IFM89_009832 [Coptis chinensis]